MKRHGVGDDDDLLGKALSEEGITFQELLLLRDWSEHTVDKEVEILKALGIERIGAPGSTAAVAMLTGKR